MIVAEKRFTEVFIQLPEIDGFKPVYKWGNEMHLLAQLKAFTKAKQSPYPLIYQLTDGIEEDHNAHQTEMNTEVVFVIACQNLKTELLNENRWAMSYENILFPMVLNIEKALQRAGIFTWDGGYKLQKFPNYGELGKNKTTDIWDAVRIVIPNIIINANCVNTINFNF